MVGLGEVLHATARERLHPCVADVEGTDAAGALAQPARDRRENGARHRLGRRRELRRPRHSTPLREDRAITLAIARITERITRGDQPRVAAALAAAARRAALIARYARRRRAEHACEPAQHDRLVLGLAVDAEIAVGGLRELDQVVERARAIVAVDAVGVARPAARDRGAALAHLVDEPRAAWPVDPAETQDHAGEFALAQQ